MLKAEKSMLSPQRIALHFQRASFLLDGILEQYSNDLLQWT